MWTLGYAGSGVDGYRFSGRFVFEVTTTGEPSDPGACAGTDLAAPGEARTIAEMTETVGAFRPG